MPQVVQERDAMLLGRDRIIVGGADDAEAFRGELVAAGRALVLAHDAGHLQRSLLAQMVGGRERVGAEIVERRDALADAGAVAQLEEVNLAAGAPVVEPSGERDFRADVFRKLLDKDALRHDLYLYISEMVIELEK